MGRLSPGMTSSPTTSFVARQINHSTFLIVEDDSYSEQPYIYVKVYPYHLLITDTGCNSPRCKSPEITSLRQFLETCSLSVNNGQALNPQGKRRYVIICSHCHYDHILGIPDFASSSPIVVCINHLSMVYSSLHGDIF